MPFETEAIVARELGKGAIELVRFCDPADDELIVRMVSTSICHSDLAAWDGHGRCTPPVITGHEGAGVIEYIGAGVRDRFQVGQHVLLSIAFCGQCKLCRTDHPAACRDMLRYNFGGMRASTGELVAEAVSDGLKLHASFFGQSAFSKRALVHASSVVPVSTTSEAELQRCAPLGCGVMTGASAMLKVLQPRKGSMIALWGAGGVGCACVMAAVSGALEGGPPALLVVIDANADRLPLARELGATHTLDALRDDVPARLAELTGGDGLDFAIDCTGVPAVLTVAHAALAPMGTLLSIGAPRDRTVPAPFPMGVHLSQSKRYIGTIQGDAIPTQFIPKLIELHKAGRFPVEKLVREYSWRDFATAMADMRSGVAVKPLLLFDD